MIEIVEVKTKGIADAEADEITKLLKECQPRIITTDYGEPGCRQALRIPKDALYQWETIQTIMESGYRVTLEDTEKYMYISFEPKKELEDVNDSDTDGRGVNQG